MATKTKELTGRKVLAITVAFFGVVIAVNLVMAFSATGTFPGLVVRNGYIASQQWNAKTDAQRALGWKASVGVGEGELAVRVTDRDGRLVEGLALTATVGRPASQMGDRVLTLEEAEGRYVAPADLGPGLWRVELHGTDARGRPFEAETEVLHDQAS